MKVERGIGKVLGLLGSVVKGAAGIVGGDIVTKAAEVIDAISGKAETDPELRKLLENSKLEMARIGLADAEGARLLIREAQKSEDAYVRRARPTFLYLMYVILLLIYVPPVIRSVFTGEVPIFPEVPEPLFYLFGTAFLGYSTLRESGKGGWFKKLTNGERKL